MAYVISYMLVAMGIFNVILAVYVPWPMLTQTRVPFLVAGVAVLFTTLSLNVQYRATYNASGPLHSESPKLGTPKPF